MEPGQARLSHEAQLHEGRNINLVSTINLKVFSWTPVFSFDRFHLPSLCIAFQHVGKATQLHTMQHVESPSQRASRRP